MPTNISLDSNIPPRWLPIIRLIWLAFALLLITGFVLGVPYLHEEFRQPCTGELCLPYHMTPTEEAILDEWGLSLLFMPLICQVRKSFWLSFSFFQLS
jgi:hypothetical protein